MLWREFLINVIEWYEKRERETAVEEKSKM